ncbi:MAG TPA: hypothetical protein VKS60_19695 [Stellaceae bacterium]|nr:hypothetical protein [Stellaceae bacterium]
MTLPYPVLRRVSMPVADDGRRAAAAEFIAIETGLKAAGRTILDELASEFAAGEHYPAGEVWDAGSYAQYFYHAHPEGERLPGEHGHFHTFLGQGGMPPGVTPLILPEMALSPPGEGHGRGVGTHRSPRDRGVVSHLAALSLDAAGRPIALFTTNRWVTGETWFRAEDVARLLPAFNFAADGPADTVNRWLTAVLRVLRPHIVELAAERDAKVMDWRRRRSRQHHVFDDRRLEVASFRRIDFAAELAALGAR